MNKKALYIGGAIGLVVIILICILLAKPKTASGDTECLFPYSYQESGKGILMTITGRFAKNGWQASGIDNTVLTVKQKRNSQNAASFLVQPESEGYSELVLTLSDGGEQDGYQIMVSFFVDSDGVLTVEESRHRESFMSTFSGTIGAYAYSGSVNQNVLTLDIEGTSEMSWYVMSELPFLQIDGPYTNLILENSTVIEEKKQKKTKNKENAENAEDTIMMDESAEDTEDEELVITTAEPVPTIAQFLITAYGSDTGTIVFYCEETQLAWNLVLETDLTGRITVVSSGAVEYDSEEMDTQRIMREDALGSFGDAVISFEDFAPMSYGTESTLSRLGQTVNFSYLRITVIEKDWYCEITADVNAEDFCDTRAYPNAVSSTDKVGDKTVIVSEVDTSVSVYWEQDGLTYRISSQTDSNRAEALSAAEALINSGNQS